MLRWKKIIAAVRLRFSERKTDLQLNMELASASQQSGRPMSQYVSYFEKRTRNAHVVDPGKGPLCNLFMGIFLNGLSNPNVRCELLVRQPTTLAEAFAAAMQLDVVRSIGTQLTTAAPNVSRACGNSARLANAPVVEDILPTQLRLFLAQPLPAARWEEAANCAPKDLCVSLAARLGMCKRTVRNAAKWQPKWQP